MSQVAEYWKSKRIFLYYLVTWGRVRVFGRLQVLTKASYTTLLVVPILASVWPQARNMFFWQNGGLETLLGQLQLEANRLAVSAAETGTENNYIDLVEATDRALLSLSQIAESSSFPPTLTLAFFSALFVALGHLIYQALAPSIVQQFDEDEFVDARVSSYVQNPTNEGLLAAKARIERHGSTIQSYLRIDSAYKDKAFSVEYQGVDFSNPDERLEIQPVDYIAVASRFEYRDASRSHESYVFSLRSEYLGEDMDGVKSWEPGLLAFERKSLNLWGTFAKELRRRWFNLASFAFTLYALATALILLIIVRQCVAILTVSGVELPQWVELVMF